MSPSIGSIGPTGGSRRVRRRGVAGSEGPSSAERAEAASAAEAAAPIPPVAGRPEDALSAHLMGQSAPAETADPANSTRQAHSTYLEVEWSGRRDRRTRRGRIAKTEI